ALRMRLTHVQIQARIESELTNIERSRQERKRLSSGEPKTGMGPVMAKPARRAAAVVPARAAGDAVPRTPVQVEAPSTDPRLVGVVRDGDTTLALVDVAGRTVSVTEGRSEGGVTVGVIDGDTAIVNGRPIQMPAGPGRVVAPPTTAVSGPAQTPAASIGSTGAVISPVVPSLPAVLPPLGAREAGWLP
ncbi:MAG TPA: hypothetical protein VF229_05540, partial [Burkholderiaceae bacterium]